MESTKDIDGLKNEFQSELEMTETNHEFSKKKLEYEHQHFIREMEIFMIKGCSELETKLKEIDCQNQVNMKEFEIERLKIELNRIKEMEDYNSKIKEIENKYEEDIQKINIEKEK